MIKPLCVVSAPVDTYSGYGSRARDFVKSLVDLKGEEWDIKILSQRWGMTPFGFIDDNSKKWGWMKNLILQGGVPKQPEYWFQITVPNEFQPIGRWNCGVTAGIETTLCDSTWVEGINRMDLTLVSSKHAKDTFNNSVFEVRDQMGNPVNQIKIDKPVQILFEGLDLEEFFPITDVDKNTSFDIVKDLNSIKESFCFLFVGHWLQGEIGEDRKNVGLLIKSFLETFKNKKSKPALVLKVSGGPSCVMDREEMLRKITEISHTVNSKDLPNIYLIHGDLGSDQLNLIYNHPKIKAMVSLTKGEGFGRPLLEFSIVKKPIAASNWSGHIDFLDPQFTYLVPGQITQVHPTAVVDKMILHESGWFSPDPSQVTRMWNELYNNYKQYEVPAKRQAHRTKTLFSIEQMTELLGDYINEYAPKVTPLKMPKMPEFNIPKLSKIE